MTERRNHTNLAIALFIASLATLLSWQMLHPGIGQAHRRVVLGAHKFVAPTGQGFGAVRPKIVSNGGDANGQVLDVHWRKWGGKVALGEGKGAQFKPGGGYYAHQVRVKFRARGLGRCAPHGPLAYTVLAANFQKRPGGPFGKWFLWSGSKSICG